MERAGAWAVVAIAAAILGAVAYFGLKQMQPEQQSRATTPPAPEAVQPAPEMAAPVPGPQARYPIPSEQKPAEGGESGLWNAVTGLVAGKSLDGVLIRQDFVSHVVATVDNLPQRKIPRRLMPVQPPAGVLAVIGQHDSATLSPANSVRYEAYMRLMQAIDTGRLIAVYTTYYPLFQQAYRDLGYPNGYFNDRVVEAIDDMLAAPDLPEPPVLNQPKVFYLFEDPRLEALSAGQKLMIRIGPLNAAKVKAKLREIRRVLVSRAGTQ